MSFREFILKLQGLPDKRKKIIMWIIVAVLGIIMVFFWFDSAAKRVSKLGEGLKKIELPQIENQIPDVKTEKKDETADWKTYTMNGYGDFEIKYPNGWYFKEIEAGIIEGGIYFSPHSPGENETGGIIFTNEALSVSISQITPQTSLLKFVEDYLNLSASIKFEIENIRIDEASGIKVGVVCDGVGCGNPHWFIVKNNNVYIFNSGLSNKKEIDIYEKMLSTFKFIK
mgnify:CR=1 FL=1